MSEREPQPAADRMADRLREVPRFVRRIFPGVFLCLVVALAASSVSASYGGPTTLYALLLGMALSDLAADPRYRPGIDFAARQILRTGVALLGARITVGHLVDLGPFPLLLTVAAVALALGVGVAGAAVLRLRWEQGVLSGGAVAICGASAALAISAVLPRSERNRQATVLTIVGITGLSTSAMVVYPLIARLSGFDDVSAGVFVGATIHDVAQVVGAGYMISDVAGQTATIVKLVRVCLLAPLVLGLSLVVGRFHRTEGAWSGGALLPGFLVAFAVLLSVNSLGWLPEPVAGTMGRLSRLFIVAALAALGTRTSIGQLLAIGWRPFLLLALTTVAMAIFVWSALRLSGGTL